MAREYYLDGIVCDTLAGKHTYYLSLCDILKLIELDDSTYQYNLSILKRAPSEFMNERQHKASLIKKKLDELQEIVVGDISHIKDNKELKAAMKLKLHYRLMGYKQLLKIINEVLEEYGYSKISKSTLKRIMKDYEIKTLWARNYKRRSKSGTKYGKTDSRFVEPNLRAILLFENPTEWMKGKLIPTTHLQCRFQLISTDIKQYNYNGGKLYETILIDEYTNEIVGFSHSTELTAESTIMAALDDMRKRYPEISFKSTIFHSDQGSQFTSEAYHKYICKIGGKISMSPPGSPNHNARAENNFSMSSKNTKDLLATTDDHDYAKMILECNIEVTNKYRVKEKFEYQTTYDFSQTAKLLQDNLHLIEPIYTALLI